MVVNHVQMADNDNWLSIVEMDGNGIFRGKLI
jgi:hypothetical protein